MSNNNTSSAAPSPAQTLKKPDNNNDNEECYNYLPPVKRKWTVENYPKLIECLYDKHCEMLKRRKRKTMPSMEDFLGEEHETALYEQSYFSGLNYTYGPIYIGRTEWRLELRIKKHYARGRDYDLFLKRISGGGNRPERLAVRISAKTVTCKAGSCEKSGKAIPLQNLNKEATFTMYTENQEVCLGQLPPYVRDSAKICLIFEALVRPENYLKGLPCDVRVVVLDKSDEGEKREGKVLAEFAAHRIALSTRSPVFKAMFDPDSKFQEAKTGVVRIGNFTPATVKTLLVYTYTKEEVAADKTYGEVLELLDIAEQYQMDEALKTQCSSRLLKLLDLLDLSNAVEVLHTADVYRLDFLKRKSMCFIRDNRNRMQSEKGREALKNLPQALMLELFMA